MKWQDFVHSAPEMAARGEERIAPSGMVLVGTLRQNGYPRICPCEVFLTGGELYLGMMWRSMKALDLLRDPRCTVHNPVSDPKGTDGEFKLWGRARDVQDLEERARFCDAVYERLQWRPQEPKFHLFALDIESAAFSDVEGGHKFVESWSVDRPEVRRQVLADP